ncbi:MAG TPA: hypothetical protein VIK18_08990 [Pirellulales bacterium]
MPNYCRFRIAGGSYFFTLVTYGRRQLFAEAENIEQLRAALRAVLVDWPF